MNTFIKKTLIAAIFVAVAASANSASARDPRFIPVQKPQVMPMPDSNMPPSLAGSANFNAPQSPMPIQAPPAYYYPPSVPTYYTPPPVYYVPAPAYYVPPPAYYYTPPVYPVMPY